MHLYKAIIDCSSGADTGRLEVLSDKFIKQFPESRNIPKVKMVLAEKESSPSAAVQKFSAIIYNHPAFEKSDFALYQACQIQSLMADWQGLRKNAILGIKNYGKSPYHEHFRFFYIQSGTQLQKYDDAAAECREILASNHSSRTMARALYQLAVITKLKQGISREYVSSLRELLLGFRDSDIYPSALLLTGNFHEKKNNSRGALAAYDELIKKFPASFEAMQARKKTASMGDISPGPAVFIPDDETINKTENIEIRPEEDLPDEGGNEAVLYAVSVGPFPSLKNMQEIKKLISPVGEIRSLQLRTGHMLYVGRVQGSDAALNLKIRLAEEYGINGRIVRIRSEENKKYIYGE